jgi:hypothetical protein
MVEGMGWGVYWNEFKVTHVYMGVTLGKEQMRNK